MSVSVPIAVGIAQQCLTESPGLATYLLIWPVDGIMRKEDIRGVYDGSIFYKKAAQHARKEQERQNKDDPFLNKRVKKLQ